MSDNWNYRPHCLTGNLALADEPERQRLAAVCERLDPVALPADGEVAASLPAPRPGSAGNKGVGGSGENGKVGAGGVAAEP